MKISKIVHLAQPSQNLDFILNLASKTKFEANKLFDKKDITQASKIYYKAIQQLKGIPKKLRAKYNINFAIKEKLKFFDILEKIQSYLPFNNTKFSQEFLNNESE